MFVEELYERFLECDVVSTDTREIAPLSAKGLGVMFFAIAGKNYDGNDFAEEALRQGAKYVVMSRRPQVEDPRFIVVTDTLKTIQALAHHHRQTLGLPVIALTGSNGKTTTKELLAAVLSKKFNTLATKGNLNNHLGVPLTLLKLKPEHKMAVIEMGANHRGEIAVLSGLAAPNYGLITNIGKAHLEGFGSEEGVMLGKGELFGFLNATTGTAFYNADDEKLSQLAAGYRRMKKIAYTTADIECVEDGGFLSVASGNFSISTRMVGDYNRFNIAAAYAIGEFFGIDKEDIVAAIEAYEPSNSRSQMVEKGGNRYIIDAYNANPSSMRSALENFHKMPAERKIAVLGDMKELGEYSREEHAAIAELAAQYGFDSLILVGEEFARTKVPAAIRCLNVEEAKRHLSKMKDALILVKGSNSMALADIIKS